MKRDEVYAIVAGASLFVETARAGIMQLLEAPDDDRFKVDAECAKLEKVCRDLSWAHKDLERIKQAMLLRMPAKLVTAHAEPVGPALTPKGRAFNARLVKMGAMTASCGTCSLFKPGEGLSGKCTHDDNEGGDVTEATLACPYWHGAEEP